MEEEVSRHAEAREARTYANHGGEAILALPKLVTTGHHQDPEAQGFRSILVRLKGCPIHVISLYFDVDFGLESHCHLQPGSFHQAALFPGRRLQRPTRGMRSLHVFQLAWWHNIGTQGGFHLR